MTRITSEAATTTSTLGRPSTINLQHTRDVLEQIALIHQAVEGFGMSSAARTHLLSARDHLASLLPGHGEMGQPFLGTMAAGRELSGPIWVSRFPGSASPDDCIDPFKSSLKAFLAAIEDAGAQVRIASTFRPPERAFLMHWSWKIARNIVDPRDAETMPGVNIDWVHRNTAGAPDIPKSRSAASQMVSQYGIVSQPALTSRHTERRAVDMDIAWGGSLSIRKADGTVTEISTGPHSGMNADLIEVGADYGVTKAQFAGDPPHWSDDGH
jgi:hypothetical protein